METSNGVTITLRTGGQGRPTPIHIQVPPPTPNQTQASKKLVFVLTNGPMDGPANRRTDSQTDQRTDIPSYRDAIAASKNENSLR